MDCRFAAALALLCFLFVVAQGQGGAGVDQAGGLAQGQSDSSNSSSPSGGYYKAHGVLLWLAFGIFFPVGILISKYGQRRLSAWFRLHLTIQVLGVVLATAGVSIGINKFDALVDTTHAKLGLAISILIWLQPLLAISRPYKGNSARSVWYFVHWLFGTGSVILAWYNMFRGFYLYEVDVSTISTGVYIAFAVQVAFLSFIYLFLERYSHLLSQSKDPKAVQASGSKPNAFDTLV